MSRNTNGAVPMPDRGPKRGGNGKFVPRQDTAERDAEAVRMRTRGATFAEIAQALEYSDPSTASRAVQRALNAARTEGVNELRQGEDAHLMALRAKAWQIMENPGRVVKCPDGEPIEDAERVLKAIDRLVRIAERRSRLWGLDAPAVHKISTSNDLDDQIEALIIDLEGRAREDERRRLLGEQ